MKEISQGLLKAATGSYTGRDGKEHAKFITVGELFAADPEAEGGAKSHVRMKMLPFPQPGPNGSQCWLHVFPEGTALPEKEPKEEFKLTGVVLSDGLQIGVEFSSPSGRRTIKLEANPVDPSLLIYDLKPKEKDAKHDTKRNRKDS